MKTIVGSDGRNVLNKKKKNTVECFPGYKVEAQRTFNTKEKI